MLPVRLGVGMVSIYGADSQTGGNFSAQTIIPTTLESRIRFGVITGMNNQYGVASIGQSVMYNIDDILPSMYYNGTEYYILPEDKISAVENPYIAP